MAANASSKTPESQIKERDSMQEEGEESEEEFFNVLGEQDDSNQDLSTTMGLEFEESEVEETGDDDPSQ